MKASGEDGEAPAGGPWEECFEAAVQLALRAGQVRAAQGARRALGDLGHSGCRAWRTETPRAGTLRAERLRARAAEGFRSASGTPMHLPLARRGWRPGSLGLGAQDGLARGAGSRRADGLGFDPGGETLCGCPEFERGAWR